MGFRQNILMTMMMLLEVAVDILGKPVLTARVWTVSLTRPLHGKGLGGGGRIKSNCVQAEQSLTGYFLPPASHQAETARSCNSMSSDEETPPRPVIQLPTPSDFTWSLTASLHDQVT